ncbi:MAG: galactokinase [Planctomycetota bacterium]
MVNHDDVRARLGEQFRKGYGQPHAVLTSAPGRVNLIGEHTDYNDGFVLPAAIDRRTFVAVGPRAGGGRISFMDFDADRLVEVDPSRSVEDHDGPGKYVAAVWEQVRDALGAKAPGGFDACISSTVPIGGGLSSSAALEVSLATALYTLAGAELPSKEELALLCQRAEHAVGVPCGIMDQFASCLGVANHAVMIDCRDQSSRVVPMPVGASLVIADSGVRHNLADGSYAKRRQECEAALTEIAPFAGGAVASLRDVAPEQVAAIPSDSPSNPLKRARHVVTENARVEATVAAFASGDLKQAGEHMVASHESLRDDFEVSCAELDALVVDAVGQPGVHGSRMTGGGFGGCTVTLVATEHADALVSHLEAAAEAAGRPKVRAFRTVADDGARIEE